MPKSCGQMTARKDIKTLGAIKSEAVARTGIAENGSEDDMEVVFRSRFQAYAIDDGEQKGDQQVGTPCRAHLPYF